MYRVTGNHNGTAFITEAMVCEEQPAEVCLTYRLPDGTRVAEWFWRDGGKRHADNGDEPFRMDPVEPIQLTDNA